MFPAIEEIHDDNSMLLNKFPFFQAVWIDSGRCFPEIACFVVKLLETKYL